MSTEISLPKKTFDNIDDFAADADARVSLRKMLIVKSAAEHYIGAGENVRIGNRSDGAQLERVDELTQQINENFGVDISSLTLEDYDLWLEHKDAGGELSVVGFNQDVLNAHNAQQDERAQKAIRLASRPRTDPEEDARQTSALRAALTGAVGDGRTEDKSGHWFRGSLACLRGAIGRDCPTDDNTYE